MRVTTLLISLGACALLIGGQAGPSAAGSKKNCKHYCVSVTPSTGDPETVFVFRGRGWVPNRRMDGPRPITEGPRPPASGGGPVTFTQYNKNGRPIKRTRRYLANDETP